MNTTKVIHQAKLNNWADLIREQQASTMNVTKFCDAHSISKSQFYYWKRRLTEQFVESQLPDIVPITSPVPDTCCTTFKSCTTNQTISALSTLKLTINDITIEITEDTSDFLLNKVIKAVRNA
ncbi:hypothetical protein SAMN02910298_02967 [Pseudobutyrivibrio sp. YE44]|jgi:hypothetical protein|uniref:IS66 family insertion sequence element accessory protein TnpA n=1 Tax=Pseudobutyrivibrio sp. YE44 TaxID=1520802 RepID=UPI00087FA06A|nr:hypothetical protein [Pseudobutyrivibrio sp. YE44]SDB57557.1 hypothetical protein SAMN02910298_02967 [Pseudobutyrivibrio sp. YE44]